MKRKPYVVVLVLAALIVLSGFMALAQEEPTFTREQLQAMANARDDAPKVGDVAPLFRLELRFNDMNNEKYIDLNDLVGTQPIMLIFGSYT